MIYIKRFDFKKMFKAILGVLSIPFSFIGIIEILHIKEIIDDTWIKLLGIDQDTGLYYGLTILSDKSKHSDSLMWALFLFLLFLIIIQIAYFLYENRLESILLIEHNSLNKMYFRINKECRNSYIIVPYKLNQYTTFNSNLPLKEKLNIAITELENHIDKINDKIGEGKYWAGYAGIANIPMTFMLGFELGDENRKLLFHKYHGRKTSAKLKDDSFHLLKEDERRFVFKNEIIEKSKLEKKGKLLLLIELTQPIREADYKAIQEENDYIIKFHIADTINYDVVDSSSQIDEYTDEILHWVAENQKNSNIVQIKICIAASSAFIFALGMKFSKTQNKETVIFHYEKDTYPWGVNVHKRIPVIIKEV